MSRRAPQSLSNVPPNLPGNGRLWLLGLLAAAVVVALSLLPPLPDPRALKVFVDGRTLFGIANFLNVVSNVPLLLVGVWGLFLLTRQGVLAPVFAEPAEKWPYAFLSLAVALTSFGSAYYHLAPDDARLMWDRLPMSVGFMALFSAVVVERISVKAGLRLLVPLMIVGAASVLYWRWSALRGGEDVLPYAVVQYGAIAGIVVIALLFPSRYTRGADLFAAVAIYAAAKGAEVLDGPIYALGGIVSGHTLKHVIAAAAIYVILRSLARRTRY